MDLDQIAAHLRHVAICRQIADALRDCMGSLTAGDFAKRLQISVKHLGHLLSGDPGRAGGTGHLRLDDILRRTELTLSKMGPTWWQEGQLAFLACLIEACAERGGAENPTSFLVRHPEAVAAIDVAARYDFVPTLREIPVPDIVRRHSLALRDALSSALPRLKAARDDSHSVATAIRHCLTPFDCLLPELLEQSKGCLDTKLADARAILTGVVARFMPLSASPSTADSPDGRPTGDPRGRSLRERILSTDDYAAAYYELTLVSWKDLMRSLLRSEKFLLPLTPN